jgi:hypothetical protein
MLKELTSVVAADGFGQVGAVQQIALLDGHAIVEWFEPLGRADKCRYGVTLFYGLANDLEAGASGGSEDNEFHGLVLLMAGCVLSTETIGECSSA